MDESPLIYRATVVSDDSNFDLSTALFHVTMYRQFARKVGRPTSANSPCRRRQFRREYCSCVSSSLRSALLSRSSLATRSPMASRLAADVAWSRLHDAYSSCFISFTISVSVICFAICSVKCGSAVSRSTSSDYV